MPVMTMMILQAGMQIDQATITTCYQDKHNKQSSTFRFEKMIQKIRNHSLQHSSQFVFVFFVFFLRCPLKPKTKLESQS